MRNISGSINISLSSVQRILKRFKFHPFKIILVQELHGNDQLLRTSFCDWAKRKIRENEEFFSKVMFSDEATFSNNGNVNRHNCHYWSKTNPHWTLESNSQTIWSVNVWCGILGDHIIGPHFIEGNLTGDKYLNLLTNVLPALLEDLPLQLRRCMWVQQDGAPPHFARNVRAYLDRAFQHQWIGREGPVNWPPRSPDLTPLDFFLWGYIKSIVYTTRPLNRDDLRERILVA
jgi:hypothetical protein